MLCSKHIQNIMLTAGASGVSGESTRLAGSPLGSSADLNRTCASVLCLNVCLIKDVFSCGNWGSAPHGSLSSRLAGECSHGEGRGSTRNPQCARLVQASACTI